MGWFKKRTSEEEAAKNVRDTWRDFKLAVMDWKDIQGSETIWLKGSGDIFMAEYTKLDFGATITHRRKV